MYPDFSTATWRDQILQQMRYGKENEERRKRREVGRERNIERKRGLRKERNNNKF